MALLVGLTCRDKMGAVRDSSCDVPHDSGLKQAPWLSGPDRFLKRRLPWSVQGCSFCRSEAHPEPIEIQSEGARVPGTTGILPGSPCGP
ncbi:hypothetical protein NDU88_008580 [Pleurodeles waltl]|uniref:Uncharacterized protein n=1 Tax=Pleurodeles waltl TaxID=8319 RepID=A0AAV7QQ43_PLEWA|nr:hypothetical protein NDU88_008580 [Pleurodeles waltl]